MQIVRAVTPPRASQFEQVNQELADEYFQKSDMLVPVPHEMSAMTEKYREQFEASQIEEDRMLAHIEEKADGTYKESTYLTEVIDYQPKQVSKGIDISKYNERLKMIQEISKETMKELLEVEQDMKESHC